MSGEAVAEFGGQMDECPADSELIAAATRDPAAFGALYERHRPAVSRYLRGRAESDEEAADLTAMTFERALRGLSRYRPTSAGFLPWLLRIAHNAAVDGARRERRAVPLEAISGTRLEPAARGDPEADALRETEAAELRRRVQALGEPAAEAIVLRYAAGLTAREIGVVIGRSEAATHKILLRALQRLREAYRVHE